MLNKKVLVIALNLVLTLGTIACVVNAKENEGAGITEYPMAAASAVPEPTPEVPLLGVSISVDKEDKYMPLNSEFTLSADVMGAEGREIVYHWQENRNSGEWIDMVSSEQSVKVILNHAGKIESEYRCKVTLQDGSPVGESEIFKISKIVYKEKLNLKLGGSFTIEDIFGGVSVKGAKCNVEDDKYSKCINESKKKGKKIYTVAKYYKKIPLEIYPNDKECYLCYISVKKPAIKDFAKDIKITLSKNKTKLTAKFKNIAGISIIQFTPKGLKTDTIKKKEGKGDCTVVYRYKAKFKMKKFAVRYGYKSLGSKKVKYTKRVNVSV